MATAGAPRPRPKLEGGSRGLGRGRGHHLACPFSLEVPNWAIFRTRCHRLLGCVRPARREGPPGAARDRTRQDPRRPSQPTRRPDFFFLRRPLNPPETPGPWTLPGTPRTPTLCCTGPRPPVWPRGLWATPPTLPQVPRPSLRAPPPVPGQLWSGPASPTVARAGARYAPAPGAAAPAAAAASARPGARARGAGREPRRGECGVSRLLGFAGGSGRGKPVPDTWVRLTADSSVQRVSDWGWDLGTRILVSVRFGTRI